MNSISKVLSVLFLILLFSCTSSNQVKNKNIKILSTQEIQSIEDLKNFKDFKNKVLYLNFWEVKSQPSILELENYKELYDKFKNDSVEFVFLTVLDSDAERNEKWMNTIYKYRLEGYHILNNNFLLDILKCRGEVNVYPMFFIFNKNGELIINNAAKPSNKSELYKQLGELL